MLCTSIAVVFSLAASEPDRSAIGPSSMLPPTAFCLAMERDDGADDLAERPALHLTDVQRARTPAADFFAKGSRTWAVQTGVSRDPSLGYIHSVQVEYGLFVRDNLSWIFGATFGYADAKRDRDGVLAGPEVGARWHVLRGERASFFIEGTAGIVLHQHPITEESLHFNFDLKAGAGMTWRLDERTAILSSLRWHHLSNARVKGKSRNLGYDGPMISVGIMRSF